MKLDLTGPAYSHPSQLLEYQRCVNYFPVVSSKQGRGMALLPTPGLNTVIDTGGTEVRAIIYALGKVYCVVDNTVYKLTISVPAMTATKTSIGTITSTTGPVRWASNPTQIMLVDGTGAGYVITAATDTLSTITDVDFLGGDTVVFMDTYFIYNRINSGQMLASNINDGTDFNSLDVVTAEGRSDDLVAVVVDKRELIALGTDSVEIWSDTANATGFPFSVRQDVFIDIGCSAAHSAINIDNTIMWLDNRRYVVQMNGYNPQPVSTDALAAEFQTYSTVSDAIAYQYVDRGHLFYVITFPSANKTWAYDMQMQMWHEKTHWNQLFQSPEYHQVQYRINYQGYELVGGKRTGKIYLMKHNYYSDAGDMIERIRTTLHYDKEFNYIRINKLDLRVETGFADVTGSNSTPEMSMRYSNDGGHTWSNFEARSMGVTGEYYNILSWNRLGSAKQWLFEFSTAAAVKHAILDASVNIQTQALQGAKFQNEQ